MSKTTSVVSISAKNLAQLASRGGKDSIRISMVRFNWRRTIASRKGSMKDGLIAFIRSLISSFWPSGHSVGYSSCSSIWFLLQEAALLDDIRTSFVRDGLQWAMQPDKKLIHLWKKLSRAEEELRKTSIEVGQISTYILMKVTLISIKVWKGVAARCDEGNRDTWTHCTGLLQWDHLSIASYIIS